MSIGTQLEDHSGKENIITIPSEIRDHLPAVGGKRFKIENMLPVVNSTEPYGRVVMNLFIAELTAGVVLILDPLAALQLGNALVSAGMRAGERAAETATPDLPA